MIKYFYCDLGGYEWFPKHLDGRYLQKLDEDGVMWTIPHDVSNSDYQQYLAWVDEGNAPEPWDPEAGA